MVTDGGLLDVRRGSGDLRWGSWGPGAGVWGLDSPDLEQRLRCLVIAPTAMSNRKLIRSIHEAQRHLLKCTAAGPSRTALPWPPPANRPTSPQYTTTLPPLAHVRTPLPCMFPKLAFFLRYTHTPAILSTHSLKGVP